MEENKYPTLVIGKSNKNIYQSHGNDVFCNLTNGKAGKIKPEDQSKLFSIPIVLNAMVMKNPILSELISTLGLAYEGLESKGTEEELKEFIKII